MTAVPAGVRIPRDIALQPLRKDGDLVTVGQTFEEGWMLMRDGTAGTLQVATEAAGLLVGGFADRASYVASVSGDVFNTLVGIYSLVMSTLTGDSFTDTSAPAPLFAIDNNTFGALAYNPSTGAARSICGCFLRLDPKDSARCIAWIGPEGVALAKGVAAYAAATPVCRAVITSIAAYAGTLTGTLTASATGAIGTQDGVTLVAGDLVFLPLVTGGAGGATVAADSGPYVVVNPGSASPAAKFVLTRPTWWFHDANIPEAFTIKIGSEGTNWSGNEWRAFPATASKVIDTDDPHFWPRTQTYEYTIGTGFVAGGGLGNAVFYLRQADSFTSTNKTSAHANWASTITTGAGGGALVFTGTASDVMVGQAINF
jgi:hypothetical protein